MNLFTSVPQIVTEPTTTYTYKQPFHIEWFLVLMAVPLGALAYHFYKQGCQLRDMQRECTVEVPAVITAVRKGYSIDGHFGGRGPHYNADYQYEYNGTTYESRNSIYGQQRLQKPRVGDMVTICIHPFEPTTLFDPLAEAAMRFYFTSCVLLGICVWMMTFGQVIMQIMY